MPGLPGHLQTSGERPHMRKEPFCACFLRKMSGIRMGGAMRELARAEQRVVYSYWEFADTRLYHKSEKSCRYKIIHSGACAAGPGTCDRIGEIRSGLSPRVAALTSGMFGKYE